MGELISGAEQWEYGGCGEVRDISPGWGDTHGCSVSGQELNIEAVPDGEFALRSVADPDQVRELEKPWPGRTLRPPSATGRGLPPPLA